MWRIDRADADSSLTQRVWDEMFGHLEAFKDTHGHPNVHRSYKEFGLGSWLCVQRAEARKSKLDPRRAERLKAIGVTWGKDFDERWHDGYNMLLDYRNKHGHCDVEATPKYREENPKFYNWVSNQRAFRESGTLLPEREAMLDSVAFTWKGQVGSIRSKRSISGGRESSLSAKRPRRSGQCRRGRNGSMRHSNDDSDTKNLPLGHDSVDLDMENAKDSESLGSDNDNTEYDENRRTDVGETKIQELRDVRVGQRIAMEFSDTELKFGEVEICFTMKRDPKKWAWHVGFDDGETYELDPDEMIDALDTYRRYYDAEMSDPNRLTRVAAIVTAFEIRKQLVLSMIPDDYKKCFLQIGFAKWAGSYQGHLKYFPVLFLGPYDVSEGPLRQKMYDEIKKAQKTGKRMPRLVYWYGEKIEEAFSFVPQGCCMSYEEGVAKGLHELSKPLKVKLDKGLKFTKDEEKLRAALHQMEEDLPKDPVDRIRFEKVKEGKYSQLFIRRIVALPRKISIYMCILTIVFFFNPLRL